MNKEALAWAAGYWDGEGHARGWTTKGYWSPRAILTQKHGDQFERFNEATGGLGKAYGPYGDKTTIELRWGGFEKVQALMAMLWPWLGETKRQQFVDSLTKENYVPS